MRDGICRKLAYWAALVPLPAVVLALLLGSVGAGTGIVFFRTLTAGLLVISGVVYIASLILAVAYGFISKRSRILILPTTSLLLIALFIVFLPDDVREDPWRTVDVVTFAGLAAVNVMQIVALRRGAVAITSENNNGSG